MIVECPSCASQFHCPDEALSPEGRRLRCSQCGHVWRYRHPEEKAKAQVAGSSEAPSFLMVPPAEENVPAPAAPAPGLVARKPTPAAWGKRGTEKWGTLKNQVQAAAQKSWENLRKEPFWHCSRPGLIGYGASAGVLLLSFTLLALLSGAVTTVIPPARAVYDLLGGGAKKVSEQAASLPLALEDLKISVEDENGQPQAKITGRLVNKGKEPNPVPTIRVRLLGGADSLPVSSWLFQTSEAEIKAGEAISFETRQALRTGMVVKNLELRSAPEIPRK